MFFLSPSQIGAEKLKKSFIQNNLVSSYIYTLIDKQIFELNRE